MFDSPEIEQARKNSVMKVTAIPEIEMPVGKDNEKKKIQPYIVISAEKGKVMVFVNWRKKHRTLNMKNPIETTLDLMLVDMIQAFLQESATTEEEWERKIKKGGFSNEHEIPDIGRALGADKGTGPGGTKANPDNAKRGQ